MARGLGLALAVMAAGCGDDAASSDEGDALGGCAGLELGACRADPACRPDVCAGCGCDETYRGCVEAGATVDPCPELGCPRSACCSSEATCELQGAACAAPDSPPQCGACNSDPGDCTADDDCDVAGTICQPIACSCEGSSACVAGCVDDTTCGDAEHCDLATSRCEPDACDAGLPCPPNFTCEAGACTRTPCTVDADCDGYCVESACYAQPGECLLPAP